MPHYYEAEGLQGRALEAEDGNHSQARQGRKDAFGSQGSP